MKYLKVFRDSFTKGFVEKLGPRIEERRTSHGPEWRFVTDWNAGEPTRARNA